MTSKDTCLLFIILFLYLFPFCLDFIYFMKLSSSFLFNWPPVQLYLLLFNWPHVQLYLISNHIYISKWYIIHCLIYFAGYPTKGEAMGAMSPTFSETVLCQGCLPGNSLLCHSPRHPKPFWPQHSQNLVGGPVLRKSAWKFVYALGIS